MEGEIIDEISKEIPPLEIEKVLTQLPGEESDAAAHVISLARVALFLGESWEGVALGDSPEQSFADVWVYCSQFPNCYPENNLETWKQVWGEPGHVFVHGYPDQIIVEFTRFNWEQPIRIIQTLGADAIIIELQGESFAYAFEDDYLDELQDQIEELQEQGHFIIIQPTPQPTPPPEIDYDLLQDDLEF